MFEKEAEEYKLLHTHYEVAKRENGAEYAKRVENVTIQEAFREGAEFGYNKANEWHNLQKNPVDLPLESEFLKNEPDNHRYEWFIVATVGKSRRALYSFSKKKWFINYEEMKIGTSYFEPIAWCEFPEFEK